MLVERASTWSAALALWKDVHHDPPPPSSKEDAPSSALRFRGSCVRDGKHAYSSEAIAGAVGTAVLNLHPKWTVSLSDFDVEVVALVMHSHNSKTINYRGGRLAPEARHLSSLQYISTLRPSTAYLMLQLAKCQPGDVVLDCMCGVGTLPACAVRWGTDLCVDIANCTGQYASICQWSAENLPLRAACVDRILVDMPFGIRCGNSVNNSKLYPKAIAEMARVLRLHGIAVFMRSCDDGLVLLVMSKKLLMHSVRNTPSLVLVDALQVNIGGLGVGVFVLQKTSPHRAPRHKPATSTASKRKLQPQDVPPTTV
ncbi:hypothetical protein DYB25_009716 [Aphanomyces astaci]|uniref:Ribosomal RNA large subunit methyltransferase K/L-like methyltransferase domain-containing protein n=1 Tax=Aphanomyces astaci TaxID=112090 RepID=A0A397ALE8_APHAT|nr:hypothetical protein DYB25_009716 [Aphanomyces astaci]